MPTVAFISNTAESIVNFRGPLIEDLRGLGHRVVGIAPDFDQETRQAMEALGAEPEPISLARTGLNPVRDLRDVAALVRVLRRVRPDIAVARSIKPIVYGLPAAALAGVPRRIALLEGLGFVFIEAGGTGGVKKALIRGVSTGLYRVALGLSQKTIFLNEDDRTEFVARRLVDPAKTELIRGIGVDLDAWPQIAPVSAPPTFLFIGRLLREKGVGEFVEAARLTKAVAPGARFILCGDVDLNPASFTRPEVEAWVAQGLVEWPGFCDVRPWLARSTAFVLPSYREGVPRSTQEAMAMGLPVVTTDVPGCRDTVEHGRNGFLVPARDAAALAGAILRFCEDPALARQMGAASRRMAEERFEVRALNRQFIQAFGLDPADRRPSRTAAGS